MEELETTNEEVQFYNEEVETTNEEMDSTNEELETMNEELQLTDEELETINNERGIVAPRPRARRAPRVDPGSFQSRWWWWARDGDPGLDRQAEDLWGLRSDEVLNQHFLNLNMVPGGEAARSHPSLLACGTGDDQVTSAAASRRGGPSNAR